jgi:hypothetical protein
MVRTLLLPVAVAWAGWGALPLATLADDDADRQIAESALRDARQVLTEELLGHYDVAQLTVERLDTQPPPSSLPHDYGLVRVTLAFSARRNATRHPSLNPALFEPASVMCQGGLYLHCGVPVGHVFDGRIELLLALDGRGTWRAVTPHWRSRRRYPLDGYLLLDGRNPDGYVRFPTPRTP